MSKIFRLIVASLCLWSHVEGHFEISTIESIDSESSQPRRRISVAGLSTAAKAFFTSFKSVVTRLCTKNGVCGKLLSSSPSKTKWIAEQAGTAAAFYGFTKILQTTFDNASEELGNNIKEQFASVGTSVYNYDRVIAFLIYNAGFDTLRLVGEPRLNQGAVFKDFQAVGKSSARSLGPGQVIVAVFTDYPGSWFTGVGVEMDWQAASGEWFQIAVENPYVGNYNSAVKYFGHSKPQPWTTWDARTNRGNGDKPTRWQQSWNIDDIPAYFVSIGGFGSFEQLCQDRAGVPCCEDFMSEECDAGAFPEIFEERSVGKSCLSHYSRKMETDESCDYLCAFDQKCAFYTTFSDGYCELSETCDNEGSAPGARTYERRDYIKFSDGGICEPETSNDASVILVDQDITGMASTCKEFCQQRDVCKYYTTFTSGRCILASECKKESAVPFGDFSTTHMKVRKSDRRRLNELGAPLDLLARQIQNSELKPLQ